MAVDEHKANDVIYNLAGIPYVVEKEFLDQAQPIEVDFSENEFKFSSGLDLSTGCSSCGSNGSCCSKITLHFSIPASDQTNPTQIRALKM